MNRIIPILISVLLIFSCSDSKSNSDANEELSTLRAELHSLKSLKADTPSNDKEQIATFLTFQDNNAENAMNLYVDLFDNSKIINVQRWEKGGPGKEGRIMKATFSLNGSMFMCSDSPPIHDWNFSPAVSNFIECKNEAELERLFSKLSENGKIMMPLNNYGFSQKFGWVEDEFGISWQLNLK